MYRDFLWPSSLETQGLIVSGTGECDIFSFTIVCDLVHVTCASNVPCELAVLNHCCRKSLTSMCDILMPNSPFKKTVMGYQKKKSSKFQKWTSKILLLKP